MTHRPSPNTPDLTWWREAILLRRQLVALKAQTRLLRADLRRKYNPGQPRVPAGDSDGGQWTSGSGGEGAIPDWLGALGNILSDASAMASIPGEVVADVGGTETWAFYQDSTRPDGSLAERAVVNRDGSTIHSEFAEPGEASDWDERHTVTLPEGSKTTCETVDRTQIIRAGGPDGEIVARSTWTEKGPEPEATVQLARGPSRRDAAPLAETTVTSALTLFNWLSARNKLDGLRAVAGFKAGDYAPSLDAINLDFVGQLRPDEVDSACPRFAEVLRLTEAAVAAAGPPGSYASPQAYGTAVHTILAHMVNDRHDPSFRAERSYLKSQYEGASDEVPYGSLNSLRIDVYEQRLDGTVCVYDLKTGKEGLSAERAAEIARTVYSRFTGVRRIIVTEIRPGR